MPAPYAARRRATGNVGKGPLIAIAALSIAGGLIGFGVVRLLKPADSVSDPTPAPSVTPSAPASPSPIASRSNTNDAHVVKIPTPTPTQSPPLQTTNRPQGELITGQTVDLNNLGQSDKLRANVVDLSQEEARTPEIWEGHTNVITGVAYNDDGSLVVSVSGDISPVMVNGVPRPPDHSVRVWDARRGKQIRKLEGFSAPLYGVAVSPGGRFATFGDGGHWENGRWVKPMSRAVHLFDILENREITYGASGQLSPDFGGPSVPRFQGLTGSVFSSAFSPDMVRVMGGSNEGEVFIWNIGNAAPIVRFRLDAPPTWFRGIYSAQFTADGRYLVLSTDHTLWVFDAHTGRALRKLRDHKDLIWTVAAKDFNDGRGLVALTAGGEKQPPNGGEFKVHARDFQIRVWDVERGRVIRQIPGHDPQTRALVFRPKTRQFLSGGEDGNVRLWDLDSGQLLRELGHGVGGVLSVAVSPDGHDAVSGGGDCRVHHYSLPALAQDVVTAVDTKNVTALKRAVSDLDCMGQDVRRTFEPLVKGAADSNPDLAEHARHGLLSLRDLWKKGTLYGVEKTEMQALGEQLKFSNNPQLAEMAQELRSLR
jgi:WD40 repeat protein